MNCPLCKSCETTYKAEACERIYYLCNSCRLIFVDDSFRLDEDVEKKRYSFHNNNINDERYVSFLNQIIIPALRIINPSSSGLDFGCGPNPVLSKLVEQNGFHCDYYDPLFFPDIDLNKKYDIIFATECFEHFFSPIDQMAKTVKLLNPEGYLAIMTEFWSESKPFADWYYIKDPTHVCFYHLKTFNYICEIYGFEEIYCDNNRVIILKKTS